MPCASYKSNSIGRATRVPSVIPQKIPPSRVEQSGKSTTPMEPKDYHSVEIYEKSPDINLVISYHENLEINTHAWNNQEKVQRQWMHRTNLTASEGQPESPLSYLKKSHPHAWNNQEKVQRQWNQKTTTVWKFTKNHPISIW